MALTWTPGLALQATPALDIASCVTDVSFRHDGVFDRKSCWNNTKNWLNDEANRKKDICVQALFAKDPDQTGWNETDKYPVLTHLGCSQFCSNEWGWYWDPGPRTTTWLVPVFLLLINIELSPIDKKRFMAILHAVGDPIDSMWSLLNKLFVWDVCYQVAREVDQNGRLNAWNRSNGRHVSIAGPLRWRYFHRSDRTGPQVLAEHRIRIIATAFAGFEEIAGHEIKSKSFYSDVARYLGQIGDPNEEDPAAFDKWRLAAVSLADDRTNDLLRTILAVVLYIFQVIGTFVPEISGNPTSPPGGRIGSAMLLAWLLPMALFSNILGGFPSRRSCLNIMQRLVDTMNQGPRAREFQGDTSFLSPSWTPLGWDSYFSRLQSTGTIYSFRPFKTENAILGTPRDKWTRLLPVAASLPVVFGFIASFIIMWEAATPGFSCRHLWLLGVFIAWLFSAFFTFFTWCILPRFLPKDLRERYKFSNVHWWVVLIKDFSIGLPSIAMIFLSTAGLFNSCYCWSVTLTLHEMASFPLNTDPGYVARNKGIYPAAVGICLALELGLVWAVVHFWRRGLAVMRWGEGHKRQEWLNTLGNLELRARRENMFLFWNPV